MLLPDNTSAKQDLKECERRNRKPQLRPKLTSLACPGGVLWVLKHPAPADPKKKREKRKRRKEEKKRRKRRKERKLMIMKNI